MNEHELEAFRYIMEHEKGIREKVKQTYCDTHNEAVDMCNTATDIASLNKTKQLFLKVLKLASKNQYAKASTLHSIGIFYYTHYSALPGGPNQNLRNSISFFKRSLAIPERKELNDKHASTLSQLAVVYRRAASEPLWHMPPEKCYEKAEILNREALNLLSVGLPEFVRLAESATVYLNLASVLLSAKRIDEACEFQVLAYESYMRSLSLTQNKILLSKLTLDVSFLFSRTYSLLNTYSDRKEHKVLCDELLNLAPRFGVIKEEMIGTAPIDGSNPEVEILGFYKKANSEGSEENIYQLRRKLSDLMQIRASTDSNQSADRVAQLAQLACSGLARVYLKEKKFIEAFVELENLCAMRFCESASNFWYMSESKVVAHLFELQKKLGTAYYTLNELPFWYEESGFSSEKELCTFLYNENSKIKFPIHGDFSDLPIQSDWYQEVIKKAGLKSKPLDYLNKIATKCLSDLKKVENKIESLDFEFIDKVRHEQIKQNDIYSILRKHPELTLVKLDIENDYNDVLIIVAYPHEGEPVVKGYSYALPDGLVNTIRDHITHSGKPLEIWHLDFIDWRDILPSSCRNVCLLPSFFASHIPWIATGKKGSLLIELVDEVNWLPSILYLNNAIHYFEAKENKVSVNGGGTLFEGHANGCVDIFGEATDKKYVLDALSRSSIFSFYGHCEHDYPQQPVLKFNSFSLDLNDFHHSVVGSERIEFWACQSGSNIPLDIKGSPVNEAFGADMTMLKMGSKTSIGTLWPVNEIVTAHIKKFYDHQIGDGVQASTALANAQRWWVNQAADEQLHKLKKVGKSEYLKMLGFSKTDNESVLDQSMGPVLSSQSENVELLSIEQAFKHPSSWAGIRFCGIDSVEMKHIGRECFNLNSAEKNELDKTIRQLCLSSGLVV